MKRMFKDIQSLIRKFKLERLMLSQKKETHTHTQGNDMSSRKLL